MSASSSWRRWIFAVVLAAATAVAGCTAAPPATHSSSPRPATPSDPASPSPATLPALPALPDPLDRYLPSPADQAIIEAGLTDAVDACVRRDGIAAPASLRIGLTPVLAFETNTATIAGSLPLASAQRFGYTSAVSQADARLLALDKGWSVSYRLSATDRSAHARLQAALTGASPAGNGTGKSSGGCLNAGVETVLGDSDSPPGQLADDSYAVPLFLTEQAAGEMQGDPRVAAATKRWQECMSRARYSYSDPTAAESNPRWLTAASDGTSMARLAAMERPTATADARCRASAGYASARLLIFDDDLDRLIAQRQTKLRLQQFAAEVSRCVSELKRTLTRDRPAA